MDEAAAILETKAELLALTADLDVSDERALQDSYEAGKNLGDVAKAADEAVETARALGDAEDSVAAGAGPIGAIGLLVNGADDELDDARSAVDGGDYESAQESAIDAEEVVGGAVVAGIIRILGLLVLVAAGFFLRLAWKAHRRRQADAAAPLYGPPAPEPVMAVPSETDRAEGVGGAVDDVGKLGV